MFCWDKQQSGSPGVSRQTEVRSLASRTAGREGEPHLGRRRLQVVVGNAAQGDPRGRQGQAGVAADVPARKELNEINRELIEKIGEAKRAEATAATANRYLALIRSILRKASLEWEWIERVPKIRLYSEPKRRIEWLTPQEVKTLLRELPEHQRDIVLFALVTGLRQANITNLE